MTRIDHQLRIVPGAAEHWTYNHDATAITFHLRDRLVYHDGTPVRADDFVQAIYRTLDPHAPGSYQSLLSMIRGQHAQNWHTSAEQHLWNGSLQMVSIDKERRVIIFAANSRYWGGPPLLQEIHFYYQDDRSKALQAYRQNQIDILDRAGGLQRKAGLDEEAEKSYLLTFMFSEHVNDLITMEAAAQALCRLAYQREKYTSALHWARRLTGLLEQIGDYQQLYRNELCIVACLCRLGSVPEALVVIERVRDAAGRDLSREYVGAIDQLLRALQSGTPTNWERWLPDWPSTLLRWPTHLFLP